MKIKCSKIVYDPDFAKSGLKKTMTVELDDDWLDIFRYEESYYCDDAEEDFADEIDDMLLEEIERMSGCPVLSIGSWRFKYAEI